MPGGRQKMRPAFVHARQRNVAPFFPGREHDAESFLLKDRLKTACGLLPGNSAPPGPAAFRPSRLSGKSRLSPLSSPQNTPQRAALPPFRPAHMLHGGGLRGAYRFAPLRFRQSSRLLHESIFSLKSFALQNIRPVASRKKCVFFRSLLAGQRSRLAFYFFKGKTL